MKKETKKSRLIFILLKSIGILLPAAQAAFAMQNALWTASCTKSKIPWIYYENKNRPIWIPVNYENLRCG